MKRSFWQSFVTNAMVVLVNSCFANPGLADSLTISDSQREVFQGIVREYIAANPEIVGNAIEALLQKQQDKKSASVAKVIAENHTLLFSSGRQLVLGNPNGDVTLVEFFDFNCGYCKQVQSDITKILEKDHNLRVVLKEFPILGEGSVEAARVEIAVSIVNQEKAKELHGRLIAERGQINGERALLLAAELGMDVGKLRSMMNEKEITATIEEVRQLGNALSINATPSFVTQKGAFVGAVSLGEIERYVAEMRD